MIRSRVLLASLALVVLSFVGLTTYAAAQQTVAGATPVQQVQPLYSCNQTATATGAANTAVTATLTPPAGQYVYICSIDITIVANAAVTGAAGPAPIFTTTNLPVNLVWWGNNTTLVTGDMKPVIALTWPTIPLKSNAAGTAFTVVTSAGQATESARINLTAFFGQ